MIDFSAWNHATGSLDWGVQKAFHEALTLVSEGKISMAFGTDYAYDGTPCLVNSTANMLGICEGEGGEGKPSQFFSNVVREFDRLNGLFRTNGVNGNPFKVSPLAAEILLANFGELADVPDPDAPIPTNVKPENPFSSTPETTDEAFAFDWIKAISEDNAPADPETEEVQSLLHSNPWDERS